MARLAGQTKISLDEIRQTINLNRRLGRKLSIEELEAFALEAIELINQRTLSNETVYGGSFANYSKVYADKKGVSQNAVDLFLNGDMLDSLDYEIDEDAGTVEIKVLGDLQIKKGYNHHVGDTLPRRPWFGITTEETNSIAEALISDEVEVQEERITLADIARAVSSIGLDVELD